MSIRLNCAESGKILLIITLGVCGLCLNCRDSGVEARGAAMAQIEEKIVYGDSIELAYCGAMVSRVNLLEPKATAASCTKKDNLRPYKPAASKIRVTLTAYSSTVWQTDDTPFITANGTYVHDGVVANNGLPFGTELRIPELFGDKVFSVEDRMHQRMGAYKFDIWFPTYEQAKNFGVKYAYVEVLKK